MHRPDNGTPTGFRGAREARLRFSITCRIKKTTYAMKTALESASVAQLLGENSHVSIGADEDCDCADQDGLSMENVVSVARSTRVTNWQGSRIL